MLYKLIHKAAMALHFRLLHNLFEKQHLLHLARWLYNMFSIFYIQQVITNHLYHSMLQDIFYYSCCAPDMYDDYSYLQSKLVIIAHQFRQHVYLKEDVVFQSTINQVLQCYIKGVDKNVDL